MFGLISLGNAVWMLVAPLHWYHELPAAVPDFGPFNPHFVRDIGCAFATIGFAFVWAALAPRRRFALAAVGTFFYVAHAVLHVFDTLREAVEPEHVLARLSRRLSARDRAAGGGRGRAAPTRRRRACDSSRLRSPAAC